MSALVELLVGFTFSLGVSVVANMLEGVTLGVSGSALAMAACGFESSGL